MDPILAKTVSELGFTIVCGAVVIFLLVLLFKKFLSNASTDRKDLFDMLQKQIDNQQLQIAELKREVRKMREDKDIWFHRALDIQERTSNALISVVDVIQYCKSGRSGPVPKGPTESDCFPQDICKSCSTTTSRPAVELKDE